MEENNSFKKIEPKDEIPEERLKKDIMKRIEFKDLLGGIFGHFTLKLGQSAIDLFDGGEEKSDQKSD